MQDDQANSYRLFNIQDKLQGNHVSMSQHDYEINQLGCLLIVLGLAIPGGELIGNACKALAYGQSTVGAVLSATCGLFYLALSLTLLLVPGFAHSQRAAVCFSLLLAIAILLYNKFRVSGEPESFLLAASEVASGLTKRLLLTAALACDPESSALGRLIHPFHPVLKKSKKE